MEKKRCCSTCKYMKRLIKWDYSGGGCKHSEYDGFVCLACAFEDVAIHMVGADPDVGACEVWAKS